MTSLFVPVWRGEKSGVIVWLQRFYPVDGRRTFAMIHNITALATRQTPQSLTKGGGGDDCGQALKLQLKSSDGDDGCLTSKTALFSFLGSIEQYNQTTVSILLHAPK